MISLNGYSIIVKSLFKRVSLLFLSFSFLFSLFYGATNAQEPGISSTAVVGYEIDDNGDLVGSVVVSLTNESETPIPIKLFNTEIPFRETNSITAKYSNKYLDLSRNLKSNSTELKINLDNLILRKNAPITVFINFTVPNYYNTSEPFIKIPTKYSVSEVEKVTLIIPNEFSNYVSIQPSDYSQEDLSGGKKLSFSEIDGQEISILLDDTYVFSLLQKHTLVNSDDLVKDYEIIIPPSSESQNVLINSIEPIPNSATIDSEGNVVLQYKVPGSESTEVIIRGYIIKNTIDQDDLNDIDGSKYTVKESYWDLDENGIEIAKEEINGDIADQWHTLDKDDRDKMVLSINDLVTKKLDIEENDQDDLNVRLGATSLIEGYDMASPNDYVDLTIALMRLYNIPSRQIVGYSTNLQELYKDQSIHTWVQYWEPELGWRNLDTYLNELLGNNRIEVADSDRVVLMYRGLNPVYPQYTNFSLDEIDISYSSDVVQPISIFKVEHDEINWDIRDDDVTVPFSITNTGSTIIKHIYVKNNSNKIIFEKDVTLVPNQTIDLELKIDRAEMFNFRNRNISDLTISITALSTNEDSETSSFQIPIQFQEPSWWSYFVAIVSLILFLLVVVIIFESYRYVTKLIKHKKK